MKISRIRIRNFRCLAELDLDVDDYTVLVGANGAGKSSVLYALDWFFNGGGLDHADVFALGVSRRPSSDIEGRSVSVEVTLSDLSERDRIELGPFGRGRQAVLRRSFDPENGTELLVGTASQGPRFGAIRGAGTAPDIRAAYAELIAERPALGLPACNKQTAKRDILSWLDEWEANPPAGSSLVAEAGVDASSLLSARGGSLSEQLLQFVLVRASTDIAADVGTTGRGSALSRLIGGLVAQRVRETCTAWQVDHAEELRLLTSSVKDGVDEVTARHAERVNQRLRDLVPAATVRFDPGPIDWEPKVVTDMATNVSIDGQMHDVGRQGHGVQRAVMIAMLQALVPDAPEDATEIDSKQVVDGGGVPQLVIAIEEPEIYQHPVRARHLARALGMLASEGNAQVLVATHSPYFVRPEQFASLRRFALCGGRSSVQATTIAEIAASCGISDEKVRRRLENTLPYEFSEGFFADAVLLVEGPTDRVVLEAVAERLGTPLDSIGVVVIAGGSKESLAMASEIFCKLGTKTFQVIDGDAQRALQKYPDELEKQAKARESNEKATNDALLRLNSTATAAQLGQLPAFFGGPTTVAESFCVFNDDIEEELNHWSSFVAALHAEGGALRSKQAWAYRAAALQAETSDLPKSFFALIDAIVQRAKS